MFSNDTMLMKKEKQDKMECLNIKQFTPFLVVIADDLTGALDTAIKFSAHGADTIVVNSKTTKELSSYLESGHDVISVNAATRHLDAKEAYDVVAEIVSCCLSHNVTYIYKKTDSVFRGNIASELHAVKDRCNVPFIPFVPSYPEMNRIVEDCIMYVDGIPLAETKLAEDPFQRIISSRASDIFASSDLNVESSLPASYIPFPDDNGILIYDGKSREDLLLTARNLLKNDVRVFSGCGGFAEALASTMLKEKCPSVSIDMKALLILCGSVNDVSKKQINYLERHGYKRITLDGKKISASNYLSSEEGISIVNEIISDMRDEKIIILDTMASSKTIRSDGVSSANRVASALGAITAECLNNVIFPVFVIGGDTLLSFLHQFGDVVIKPVCEIRNGVVLSYIYKDGRKITVLSKSGGFGSQDMIAELIRDQKNK